MASELVWPVLVSARQSEEGHLRKAVRCLALLSVLSLIIEITIPSNNPAEEHTRPSTKKTGFVLSPFSFHLVFVLVLDDVTPLLGLDVPVSMPVSSISLVSLLYRKLHSRVV